MNKIHSIVWNAAAGRWVVASEFATVAVAPTRAAVPCFARCSWPSLSRWHGAAPQVQRRCSSPAPRLMLPMARGLSRTSLLPMAPPASSLATAVRWSSRKCLHIGGTANRATQNLDLSGLSHYVFDNASLDFNVGGRVMGGTRDQTGATTGTVVLASDTNLIRASHLGIGDVGRNVSAMATNQGTLRLGQNNTINADSITLGGNQSGGTLVFQDSVTDGTLTCVAPTGRAP